MKPRILLVFPPRLEDEALAIRGIVRHSRLHQPWAFHLNREDERRDADVAWFRNQKWSGIISARASPTLARTCRQLKIPLVVLGEGAATAPAATAAAAAAAAATTTTATTAAGRAAMICPDNAAIGRAGAEHVLARGFGALGFVGFSNTPWARERGEGFSGAARRAGKECAVLKIEQPREMTPAWETRQVVVISQWLRKQPRPAAIMGCCDELALLVLLAAKMAGAHVPEEIAVVGAGNDVLRCELCSPPLSSVDFDWPRAGWLAAESLAALMRNEAGGAGNAGSTRSAGDATGATGAGDAGDARDADGASGAGGAEDAGNAGNAGDAGDAGDASGADGADGASGAASAAEKGGGILRVPPAGVVERHSTQSRAIGDGVVAAALNFIREQACRGLTVEEVLGRVAVSRSVLEKKFRAHRGCSPQTEIRRAQVEKISELLRETDFPLKKIAALTGFERVEYLCVVFKRITGAAPGAYRKKRGRGGEAEALAQVPQFGKLDRCC